MSEKARRSAGNGARPGHTVAPHQLRRVHAVEMAYEGVPVVVIQRQLGHSGQRSWPVRGPQTGRAKFLPGGAAVGDTYVHLGVCFPSAERAPVRLSSRVFDHRRLQEALEQQGHQRDHDRAAEELAGGDLPADQDREDDPELNDEVRGGERKAIAAGKLAPLRAASGRAPPPAREHDDEGARGLWRGPVPRGGSSGSSSRSCRLLTTACTGAGEGEAQGQRPQDLREHPDEKDDAFPSLESTVAARDTPVTRSSRA